MLGKFFWFSSGYMTSNFAEEAGVLINCGNQGSLLGVSDGWMSLF